MLKRLLTIFALFAASLSPIMAESSAATEVTDREGDRQELSEEERLRVISNERTYHRCHRGLSTVANAFVPQGQWIVGATASYSTHVNDNYTFTLIEGIASEGYTLKASPMLAYAVKDNIAIGGRFEYGRSLLKIDSAMMNFSLDDDDTIELSVDDYYSLTSSYTAMAVVRYYIPLGHAKRFALFSETQLGGGYYQSKFARDKPVTGTYSEGYNIGLNVVPGIVAFATNDVAFEVMVGALGVNYSHTKQTHNQIETGEMNSTSVNFKINLLSIGLGVSFYL